MRDLFGSSAGRSSSFLCAQLAFVTACAIPAQPHANPASGFWEQANDRLFDVLVNETRPDALMAHLRTAPTEQVSLRGETGAVFEHFSTRTENVALDLFLGGIDAVPAAFALDFIGDQDDQIMGLRGSLSNCSEVTEPDCDRLGLQKRSEITLGVAACLCAPMPAVITRDGKTMALFPCYMGRGGTYLDWVFGFGPLSPDTGTFLTTASEAQLGDLCAASDAARTYPGFLLSRRTDLTGQPLSTGVDPNAWVSFVVGSDAETLDRASALSLIGITWPTQQ